jgi:hypothetical protein
MTNDELLYVIDSLKEIVKKAHLWEKDYCYDKSTNEFYHLNYPKNRKVDFNPWFNME